MSASSRVAVIGGGLAGMSAALRAADAGSDVVLVERRGALGGLTTSIERNGLSFDNGQHVFLRCCSAYRGFLERIGATEHVQLQSRLSVPVLAPGGRRATIARSSRRAPLHLAASLARYAHLSVAQRARLVGAVQALRRLDLDDRALDEQRFGDWLAEHGQGDAAIDGLWDLIVRPTVNVSAREASLALAAMVFRVGLLDRADAGDIGWSKIPLAQLHGAMGARALTRAGVTVQCNAAASALTPGTRGSVAVNIGDEVVSADAVIVATSPRGAANLGAIAPGVSEGLGSSPIVNVHLVFDRRVCDLDFAAAVESPIQFLFDRTASSGAAPGHQCLSISLSAADEYIARPTDELVPQFVAALVDLIPAARDAVLVDSCVTRERAATFRAVPGTAALRPGPTTDLPGVFVAGAWCDTGWPATMEGAVRSGESAAGAALDYVARAGRRVEGVAS